MKVNDDNIDIILKGFDKEINIGIIAQYDNGKISSGSKEQNIGRGQSLFVVTFSLYEHDRKVMIYANNVKLNLITIIYIDYILHGRTRTLFIFIFLIFLKYSKIFSCFVVRWGKLKYV